MKGIRRCFTDMPRFATAWNKVKSYIFFALLFTFFSFLMFSCGLPSSEYLYPPSNFLNAQGILSLYHNNSNIDYSDIAEIFKGYEIYYRIYGSNVDAINAITSLNSLYINASPDSFILNATNTYGFFPLLQRKIAPVGGGYLISHNPLIPVSNNAHQSYNLFMSNNGAWSIYLDGNTNDILIDSVIRNMGNSPLTPDQRDFCYHANYHSNDQDYSGTDSPTKVYIVFFAVAYGDSIGRSIYSEPVIITEPVEYDPGS